MSIATFNVCAGGHRVLEVECRPGTLHSTAAPPPDQAPPSHPFIHGVATDPMHEHALGTILRRSGSAVEFLRGAIEAGYDLASGRVSPWDLEGGFRRIVRGDVAVGGAWPQSGPFATLSETAPDEPVVYPHALVTVYEDAEVDTVRAALDVSEDFDGFTAALAARGLTLVKSTT